MPQRDIYTVLLRTFKNPTKVSIVFLLSHYGKMTVTQMSKKVGVGKANLYHFVNEMVRDALLSRPEAVVKKNYVEKYYQLNQKLFSLVDPSEQRKRLKLAKPEEQKMIIQSMLASLGLYLRLFAEEIGQTDVRMLERFRNAIAKEEIALSYLILPDEAYKYALEELRRMNRTMEERWGSEKPSLTGNRVIVVALPQFNEETQTVQN
jgi:DNA-binding transcriptional ArsR family regulator